MKSLSNISYQFALICMMALLAPLASANTPEQIFIQVSPSIVVVDIFDAKGNSIGLGSGTVIGIGQVITNCHVAQKGKSLKVRQSGKIFRATLQYTDPDRDLCQLSAPELQAPPVALGIANKLRVGQRVYAIGAPEGLELTLSEGLISSLHPYEGSQYIQTSAAISPGSSGGGLFDDQGRLIGITTFYLAKGQNLNFALPVDWINELQERTHNQKRIIVDPFEKPRKSDEASNNVPSAKGRELDWLNRAIALQDNKDWRGLVKFSKQWIKKVPESPLAWFILGYAHDRLKEYVHATLAYSEALRIQHDDAEGWNNLGAAYLHLKHYEQAISSFREALRIKPEYAEAWNNLGMVYNNLKQYDQAIHSLQEALRIQPKYALAWRNIGIVNIYLKQYDQAIHALQEALRIQPKDELAWALLGIAYDDRKQYDKAIQSFQESLRIQPAQADIWYQLGSAYFFESRFDKVREIYPIIRKLDPVMAERYFKAFILP